MEFAQESRQSRSSFSPTLSGAPYQEKKEIAVSNFVSHTYIVPRGKKKQKELRRGTLGLLITPRGNHGEHPFSFVWGEKEGGGKGDNCTMSPIVRGPGKKLPPQKPSLCFV